MTFFQQIIALTQKVLQVLLQKGKKKKQSEDIIIISHNIILIGI